MTRRVRLPELSIFRKYSLALRHEFAKPEELVELLQESLRQVNATGRQDPPPQAADALGSQEARPATPRPPNIGDDEDSPETFLKTGIGPQAKDGWAKANDAGFEKEAERPSELAAKEQEDFWGEARPWSSKRNKGKSKDAEKARSARPAIVRVDAEGAPVKAKAGAKKK